MSKTRKKASKGKQKATAAFAPGDEADNDDEAASKDEDNTIGSNNEDEDGLVEFNDRLYAYK